MIDSAAGVAGALGGGAAAAGANDGGASTTASDTDTSSDTGPGFSQIDLDASNNGGLTLANPPTANNSLGLDIESVYHSRGF